jgi:hypothetical protein
MAKTDALRKVVGRAARGPLNLSVLGGGVVGALVLGMWPLAALGGAAYAALVASDVTNLNFRRRVLFGRKDPAPLPRLAEVADAEVKAAIAAVLAARAEVDAVVKATPERVRRHVTAALGAIDELEGHGAALAARADELSRYLASVDQTAAGADSERLTRQAAAATDAGARADYTAAAAAASERVQALRDIAAARERALAHLARIAAAMRAVPTKLVRLRVLDDQASDALTNDVGSELERMNIDLRAFEQTLQALVEVPS